MPCEPAGAVVSGKALFIKMVNDSEIVARAREKAKGMFNLPNQQGVFLAWYLLWIAGMEVQLYPFPERMVKALTDAGFKALPASAAPLAGDIFVCVDSGQPRFGIVAKTSPLHNTFFMAVDEIEAARPYRRNLTGIAAWYRHGAGG